MNWTDSALHTYDHYGYALMAILGTFAIVALVPWFMQRSRWAPWVLSLQGVVPPFINIIGVLFGLTLAFLANDTWSAHDRAMNAVYREADALRILASLSGQLPEPFKGRLRTAIKDYAGAAAAEWPDLAQRRTSREVAERADALLALLATKEVEAAAGSNTQALMLRKAGEIRDDREMRIALSQTHVNPLKWLGMAFLGLLTLLSVAVVHAEKPRAAMVAVMLFALAAAPTAAIVLIQGNPFQQPTAVLPTAIAEVARGL